MPINTVDLSTGFGGHERVDFLMATIYPRHLTFNQRVNFPRSGQFETRWQQIRAPGDERGHLVASQFSGPPTTYNLSPQSPRVNRNAGYQALNTDWYSAECEVRNFLAQGGNRTVYWLLRMTYVGNSNQPDTYRLVLFFINNGHQVLMPIETTMHNPFLREDSSLWICRRCRSSRHDELRRRENKGIIECSCARMT